MAMKNLFMLMMIIVLFVSSVPPIVSVSESVSVNCGLCVAKCLIRKRIPLCVLCVPKCFPDGAPAPAPAPATMPYPAPYVAPAPPTIPNSAASVAFPRGLSLLVAIFITCLIW